MTACGSWFLTASAAEAVMIWDAGDTVWLSSGYEVS